jgi:hypothetical protein
MDRKHWEAVSAKYLKKRLRQRARVLIDQLERTYAEDKLWAEQWLEIAQVCLTGARLALERSENAPSLHDQE